MPHSQQKSRAAWYQATRLSFFNTGPVAFRLRLAADLAVSGVTTLGRIPSSAQGCLLYGANPKSVMKSIFSFGSYTLAGMELQPWQDNPFSKNHFIFSSFFPFVNKKTAGVASK